MLVGTKPGAIQLHPHAALAHLCTPFHFAELRHACLAHGVQGLMPGAGARTAAEVMLMMEPPRCATITLPAAWHPYSTPLRFTARMRSNSSGSTPSTGLSIMMPAMLQMMCRPRWRAELFLQKKRRAPCRHVEFGALGSAALAEDARSGLGRGGAVDVGTDHGRPGASQYLGGRAPDARRRPR